CSVLFVVYASWISNTTLIEYKNLDQYRLPPMHYVLMGLRGIGGYNGADHQAAQALPDADTRTRVAKEKIAAQLEEYGFSGMRDHMVQKIRFTWNAGLFYSDQKLAQNKAMYTTAQSYASPEGLNFPQYHAYAQSFHWLMLLTGAAKRLSISRALRSSGSCCCCSCGRRVRGILSTSYRSLHCVRRSLCVRFLEKKTLLGAYAVSTHENLFFFGTVSSDGGRR
ncbi:MAG: hypothetical protein RRY38_02680, partial [Oscillospiraceae bacterium]